MNAGWLILFLATLWLAVFGSIPGRAAEVAEPALQRDRR